MDINEVLKDAGVSTVVVGVITPILVQVIKWLCKTVTIRPWFLPEISGGVTQLIAFLVAVGLSTLASYLGYGAGTQERAADVLLMLLTAGAGFAVSQGVYKSARAATQGGTDEPPTT